MDHAREKIERRRLEALAAECYDGFRNAASKKGALCTVADRSSAGLGRNLNAGMLASPDDVSIGFIELLDLIMFEMVEENACREGGIEEYIVDDLYQRLEVYLDLFSGLETYRKNFHGRILNHDDTVIIRHYRITDFVPLLVAEFFEQPALRKSIAHALMFFGEDELLNFFYEIAKNGYDIELKIPALVGLGNNRSRFYNWHHLKGQGDEKFDELIAFVIAGEMETDPARVPGPANSYIAYYRLLKLEIALEGEADFRHCGMMLDVLNEISRHNIDAIPFKQDIYGSLTRILNKIHRESMRGFFSDEDHLATFMYLIDSLPMDIFDRIIISVEGLGEEFIGSVKRLISRGKLQLDEKNSRLSGYLLSLGFDPILL